MKSHSLLASFVSLVALAGCERLPPAAPLRPPELRGNYERFWRSAKTEGRPLPLASRELYQLGIAQPGAIALWHAADLAHVPLGPRQFVTVARDGSRTTPKVTYVAADKSGERLTAKRVNAAERIELSGLVPGARYDVEVMEAGRIVATLRAVATPSVPLVGTHSFLVTSCNNPFVSRDGTPTFQRGRINSLNLYAARAEGRLSLDGLPERPDFTLALGDQVYVDGDNSAPEGGEAPPPEHTLSLFRGKGSKAAFGSSDAAALLDIVYRYNFALPPVDDALRALPTAMMWDDHDVRDGFNNHGDEAWLQDYTKTARAAFVAYQGLRNPSPPSDSGSLAFDFSWGKNLRVFMLDSRSERRYGSWKEPHRLVTAKQLAMLDAWLATSTSETHSPRLYVLGLPTPISTTFKKLNGLLCGFTNTYAEAADDIRDTWACNPDDRSDILNRLKRVFTASNPDRLLIVSGDVHTSGLAALSDVQGGHIFAYEVISSGLTNDHLKFFENAAVYDGGALKNSSGELSAWSDAAGLIQGTPSFAEITTDFGGATPPRLRVTFYPSHDAFDTPRHAPALSNLAPCPGTNEHWSNTPADDYETSVALDWSKPIDGPLLQWKSTREHTDWLSAWEPTHDWYDAASKGRGCVRPN